MHCATGRLTQGYKKKRQLFDFKIPRNRPNTRPHNYDIVNVVRCGQLNTAVSDKMKTDTPSRSQAQNKLWHCKNWPQRILYTRFGPHAFGLRGKKVLVSFCGKCCATFQYTAVVYKWINGLCVYIRKNQWIIIGWKQKLLQSCGHLSTFSCEIWLVLEKSAIQLTAICHQWRVDFVVTTTSHSYLFHKHSKFMASIT